MAVFRHFFFSGVLDGTVHRPVCPQFTIGDNGFLGDEDCLFLSVYAPADAKPDEKLPVFFWIYGGGWNFGDNYEFGLYDATNLVSKHRYIVVAPNYRLGALGFLVHPTSVLKEGNTGNYGLHDQRQAMQWAQRNIAKFGGNPGNVTILGESAGAFSICFHIASKASGGLFHRAVMESGTCDSDFFYVPTGKQMQFGSQFAINRGCPDGANQLQCLRELPPHVLLSTDTDPSHRGHPYPKLYPSFSFTATIDGKDTGITDTPLKVMEAGKQNKVPFIAGTNLDEGTLFLKVLHQLVPTISQPYDEAAIRVGLTYVFDLPTANSILAAYPAGDYPNGDDRFAKILRDFFFLCSNRRLQQVASSQKIDSYLYQFTHKSKWIDFAIMGVYHIAELFFVFDNEFPPVVHKFDGDDTKVAKAFGSYWGNFVKNGDPNTGSSVPVPWAKYDAKAKSYLNINAAPSVKHALVEDKCIFWDRLIFNKVY